MPAQQTSVSNTQTVAIQGQLADSGRDTVIRSYFNDEASAEIPFGVMVGQGDESNEGALLLTAGSDLMIGVVVHDHAYDKDNELGDDGLKPGVTMNVLTHGRVWVNTEEAVDPGDPVRVRAVAGGSEQAGDFRTTADGTDTVDISQFARWLSVTSGAGLALLEIDMTNVGLANPD